MSLPSDTGQDCRPTQEPHRKPRGRAHARAPEGGDAAAVQGSQRHQRVHLVRQRLAPVGVGVGATLKSSCTTRPPWRSTVPTRTDA